MLDFHLWAGGITLGLAFLISPRLLAQNPIDIPITEEPASEISVSDRSDTWSVSQSSPFGGDNDAMLQTQMQLNLKGGGLGVQAILLQKILPFLSTSQTIHYHRWDQIYENQPLETETRGSLGIYFSPNESYLFEPFAHLQGGYEAWQTLSDQDAMPVGGHEIGLMVKLTRYFWLSILRRDLYYWENREPKLRSTRISDRHYASSEAYFILAF